MEDFIASNAGWIILFIITLAYPVKLLFRALSSKFGINPVVSDAIVDRIAESSTDVVFKIQEQKRASIVPPLDIKIPMPPVKPALIREDGSTVSVSKDGFRIIKQPSNPNNNVNNGDNDNEKATDISDSDASDDPDRSKQL